MDGRFVEGADCGRFSPDGRWMTYRVRIPGSARNDWDQWLVDVEAGTTRLLIAGVRSCGGCDGVSGPQFSPDSRRFVVAEYIDAGRLFLADLAADDLRVIAEGRGLAMPSWSKDGSRMLYSPDGTRVLLEDFARGTTAELSGLPWPATFDTTDRLIYSPAVGGGTAARTTHVVDASSLTRLVEAPGEPTRRFFGPGRSAVAVSPRGLVLALEAAPGCTQGTTVYAPDFVDGRCFANVLGAAVSPDGAFVAMSEHALDTPPGRVPWEIVVLDVEAGEVSRVGSRLLSEAPPVIRWNEGGR